MSTPTTSVWITHGPPGRYECTYKKLSAAPHPAIHPDLATTTSRKTFEDAIGAGRIPISTSRPSVEYAAFVTSDRAKSTVECVVYHKGEVGPILTAFNPSAEVVVLREQVRILMEEAEHRREEERRRREEEQRLRDVAIRYELSSRTLLALDDRLFASLALEEQESLWINHCISKFAQIRIAHHDFEYRKETARRHHRLAQPSDLDRSVARICELPDVNQLWTVILSLESEKRDTGVVQNEAAHPAPAVADFVAFARRIGLSNDVRDDLKDAEYYANSRYYRYFTP